MGTILVLLNAWLIDYKDLLSRENLGNVLLIISNLLFVAAMVVSIKRKEKEL